MEMNKDAKFRQIYILNPCKFNKTNCISYKLNKSSHKGEKLVINNMDTYVNLKDYVEIYI